MAISELTTEQKQQILLNGFNDCMKHHLCGNYISMSDIEGLEITDIEGKTVFVDGSGTIIIDETVYNDIAQIISTFTGHKRTPKKKFGNAFAKKKRIEQDYRQKEKARNSKKEQSNFLDKIILRLVCNANFPYNFETILDVTIYDLIYSLKQIDKDIEVTDIMQSRLVGNDLTKIPREQLSRFIL